MLSVIGIINGWVVIRHNSLKNRLDSQDREIQGLRESKIELEGKIAIERAEREHALADIRDIRSDLREIDNKLDRLLAGNKH